MSATTLLDTPEPLSASAGELLVRFGLSTYAGPRGLIAGYRHDQVPDDLVAEWEELFGRFRSRLLAPLVRAKATLERRDPDSVRKLIQQRDRVAAEMANREMRRRYGGPKKQTRRELAGPNRWH